MTAGLAITDVTPVRAAILYARAGEMVTCADGHPICEVVRDLPLDAPADFTRDLKFSGRRKRWAQRTSGCKRCGALWIVGQDGGGTLHFAEGWRYVELQPEPHVVHRAELARA